MDIPVHTEDLTKALNCRESDIQEGDSVHLKVKERPQHYAYVLVSAESKTIEGRIQEEERGCSFER